jgi:hypothetical protein
MAHNVNPQAYNNYLVHHGVPPGAGHWTVPVCRGHPPVEGPDAEIDFERWWALNGGRLRAYVRNGEAFVRDRLLPAVRQEEAALAAAVRAAAQSEFAFAVPRTARAPIDGELYNLMWDIGEFRQLHRGAEFGLERVRDRQFTQAQWDRHPAEVALYERAEAGSRLLRRIASQLRSDQMSACERELLARLAQFARLAEAWLAEAWLADATHEDAESGV